MTTATATPNAPVFYANSAVSVVGVNKKTKKPIDVRVVFRVTLEGYGEYSDVAIVYMPIGLAKELGKILLSKK